jgi:hypothetical protein
LKTQGDAENFGQKLLPFSKRGKNMKNNAWGYLKSRYLSVCDPEIVWMFQLLASPRNARSDDVMTNQAWFRLHPDTE